MGNYFVYLSCNKPTHLSYLINCLILFQLGASIGAHAISHLERLTDDGIKAMADQHVVGMLLPTTAYILRLEPPPARKMTEHGKISRG